jgi:toxin CptA
MKSAAAIRFDYRPSRWFAACIVLVWLLALLAVAMCGLPVWAKVALDLGASLYAGWALRGFLRPPIRHLLWHAAGHWRAHDTHGQECIAQLRQATVLGGLIVLSFRAASLGKTSIVLLPENGDADTRRRLRVRLARAQAHEPQSNDAP